MRHHIRTALVFVTRLGLAIACQASIQNAEAAEPSTEAKIVAQENHASYLTQISFDKGSSNLTPNAKNSLDAILEKARRGGQIETVKIVSWADREYPSPQTKKLSASERSLADRRGKALYSYVKSQSGDTTVDTYNMAKRPNSLQKLFATPDTKVKTAFEDAGIATTAHDLRFPENASKSVVMVIMKQ